MTRALYRSLLWLHPPSFRREFAGEMLWIFDEATITGSPTGLLLDGMGSLLRQWVLRCGAWKVLAAMLAAMAQMLALASLSHRRFSQSPLPLPHSLDYYDLEFSRGLALLIILLVLGTGFRACLAFRRGRS
jgi:hypothetical protein